MASRAGPRATGTDGSDFSNRETVVSHYKSSAELKKSVQKSLIPHMLVTVLYIAKQVAVFMGSTYFLPLEYWEQLWLISGLCAFVGFGALGKNDAKRLYIYIVGNVLFGLVPLLLGSAEVINKIQEDFKDMQKTPANWKNSPMKMAMVAVCVSWQLAGLIQSIRLVNVWRSMTKRKDN